MSLLPDTVDHVIQWCTVDLYNALWPFKQMNILLRHDASDCGWMISELANPDCCGLEVMN